MDFINSFILFYRTEIMNELHYSHTYWIFLLPLVLIASDAARRIKIRYGICVRGC